MTKESICDQHPAVIAVPIPRGLSILDCRVSGDATCQWLTAGPLAQKILRLKAAAELESWLDATSSLRPGASLHLGTILQGQPSSGAPMEYWLGSDYSLMYPCAQFCCSRPCTLIALQSVFQHQLTKSLTCNVQLAFSQC